MASMSTTRPVRSPVTADKDFKIIWFTEASLSNVHRLVRYIQDAERTGDDELAEFFRRAQDASRRGAEEGERLMAARIAQSGAGPN